MKAYEKLTIEIGEEETKFPERNRRDKVVYM